MNDRCNKEVIKAGRIVVISSGKFSEYMVKGIFVALHEINWKAERDAYLEANPAQQADCYFESDEFLAFVIARGLLAEIEYDEWYLDSYSIVSEMELR